MINLTTLTIAIQIRMLIIQITPQIKVQMIQNLGKIMITLSLTIITKLLTMVKVKPIVPIIPILHPLTQTMKISLTITAPLIAAILQMVPHHQTRQIIPQTAQIFHQVTKVYHFHSVMAPIHLLV